MKFTCIALLLVALSACASSMGNSQLDWSKQFLEQNLLKPGVTSLGSGLQYKVMQQGRGREVGRATTVLVHYEGRLARNDTVFDSSYKNNRPTRIPLSRVIQGWQIAIPKMREGDKWELYIPPHLAYGERGAGRSIGPNETLIFVIELVEVVG